MGINIHKRNDTKTLQNTVNTRTHIIKTPTQLSQHPHITKPIHTHTHTLHIITHPLPHKKYIKERTF